MIIHLYIWHELKYNKCDEIYCNIINKVVDLYLYQSRVGTTELSLNIL